METTAKYLRLKNFVSIFAWFGSQRHPKLVIISFPPEPTSSVTHVSTIVFSWHMKLNSNIS